MNIERPTSNVERRMKKQISNTQHSTTISVSSSFSIQYSMLDQSSPMLRPDKRSMFDVHFFSPFWRDAVMTRSIADVLF